MRNLWVGLLALVMAMGLFGCMELLDVMTDDSNDYSVTESSDEVEDVIAIPEHRQDRQDRQNHNVRREHHQQKQEHHTTPRREIPQSGGGGGRRK